ncbi:MAG TPA: glycosyltransferase [Kofleriaceae bacterium]|nr:glycosyltransferase [Kofleriaceae bacterium]
MRAGLTVRLVTPAPPGSRSGNRVTAERWASMLERLGCGVTVDVAGEPGAGAGARGGAGADADCLVALHARRSHAEVVEFARTGRPIVVGLAGTDVYRDLPAGDAAALDSIMRADRIVALQPRAAAALPEAVRARVRVIHQSCQLPAPMPRFEPAPGPGRFRVAVVAHLRAIKDPLAAAEAAALLAADSAVEVVHVGDALDPDLAERARRAGAAPDARYRWLGPVARERALALVAGSRLLCLTSLAEGGANAITEALACGTPVISSRIEGSLGILGEVYPGLFEPGDRVGLAALLEAAATDASFAAELARRCGALAPLADPAAELASWRALVDEIAP